MSEAARWITASVEYRSNLWLCFRKTFDLEAAPATCNVRIACDSKYWLWINGVLAVFEGQLKRGPNPRDTYCDTVDIAPWVKTGENTVAVLVWYFGKDGFSHLGSGKPGLYFAPDAGPVPGSDATWEVMVHPAFGHTGEPHPNKRFSEANIRFDAQNDIPGWEQPGFDDAGWKTAVEAGAPPAEPWGALVDRPIPQWKDSGLLDYVNSADIPGTADGSVVCMELPYNCHVTPYLKIEASAGQVVDIRTDHYKGGGPENVRAEYVTSDGVQEYENPGWMNGHVVEYRIPAGIKILALKYRETGYDTAFAGSFECDDTFLNRMWQKALRTLYVTMRDTYMDCPDRERAQWWGDEVNEMGEAFYALDDKGVLLAKKGILELAAWQKEDGGLFAPVPGNYRAELPMQMLASVGYYGFWTYYLYTGDLETIRTVYPAVCRYLALWKLKDNGLVEERPGDWTWGDWGPNKDMPLLYNGWYYLALKGWKLMADALGEKADSAQATAGMDILKAAFNRHFWTGREYRSPSLEGPTDDRGHALAVVAGLATAKQYPDIAKVFETQEYSSPYMEKYVLEALCLMARPEQAVARLKKRFGKMVDDPCTTLWEGWGVGAEGYGGGTMNHAWSGGALTMMSRNLAGIEPETPGYERYRVGPLPGPLHTIKTVVPSVKGLIRLDYRREDDDVRLKVVLPGSVPVPVGIPVPENRRIRALLVNDEEIRDETGLVRGREGVVFFKETMWHIWLEMAPGIWTINVTLEK